MGLVIPQKPKGSCEPSDCHPQKQRNKKQRETKTITTTNTHKKKENTTHTKKGRSKSKRKQLPPSQWNPCPEGPELGQPTPRSHVVLAASRAERSAGARSSSASSGDKKNARARFKRAKRLGSSRKRSGGKPQTKRSQGELEPTTNHPKWWFMVRKSKKTCQGRHKYDLFMPTR